MTARLDDPRAELERLFRESQARRADAVPAVVAPTAWPVPVVDDTQQAPETLPEWVRDEIKLGLKKLVLLRLEGCPAHDAMLAAGGCWMQVFAYRRVWVAAQQPALREAFIRHAAKVAKWPAPADILALFNDLDAPRRQAAAPAPVSPSGSFADRKAEASRQIQALREGLAYQAWLQAHATRAVAPFDALWERVGLCVRGPGDPDLWRLLDD
jgi:hypothetical protein